MTFRITIKTLRPRNPVALAGRLRHAGSHRASAGGDRQRARQDLHREIARLRDTT